MVATTLIEPLRVLGYVMLKFKRKIAEWWIYV